MRLLVSLVAVLTLPVAVRRRCRLGFQTAAPPHAAERARRRPYRQSHRRLHPRPVGGTRTRPQSTGRPRHAAAPRNLRPDRPAADQRRAGSIPARRRPKRLPQGGRATAGVTGPRRARAQHWLDLVRYAETDGFKADEHRPAAHRYRDYVIAAFNADLPYDRFVCQQLAGDELEPDNPQALIATGLNRLWPDEYNAANLEQRRQEILDDVTDTTGAVFLGLTVGCARCHDHKFDPTSQVDYFRLQAFFAPMQPRDDLFAVGPASSARYRRDLAAWKRATHDVRTEMETLLADKRAQLASTPWGSSAPRFSKPCLHYPGKRTPYQEQIAALAEKQLHRAELDAPKRLSTDRKKRYAELERRLKAMKPARPQAPTEVMAVIDIGRCAPPTHRLLGGNWRRPHDEVPPGFPTFLGQAAVDTHLRGNRESTGRRAACAPG